MWSSILSTTTDRVSTLRRNLLSSENDGDTEDDTYICRMLRQYYYDKSLPLPEWLPVDPKRPQGPNSPPASAAAIGGAMSSLWGTVSGAATASSPKVLLGGGGGTKSALSDLWDTPSTTTAASMRGGNVNSNNNNNGGRSGNYSNFGSDYNDYNSVMGQSQPQQQDWQGKMSGSSLRPSMSQRDASYQSSIYHDAQTSPATGAMSAQDRLKQRLKRSATSSSQSSAAQGSPPMGGRGGWR